MKPYYAVIFTNSKTNQVEGYQKMAEKMSDLASKQEGYLGEESAPGITISYWEDLESIRKWKDHPEHREAIELGRKTWYASYKTRIALVEREYSFEKP